MVDLHPSMGRLKGVDRFTVDHGSPDDTPGSPCSWSARGNFPVKLHVFPTTDVETTTLEYIFLGPLPDLDVVCDSSRTRPPRGISPRRGGLRPSKR